MLKRTLLGAAVATMAAIGAANAANTFVVPMPAGVCMHQAPRDLCGNSLVVDLTGVTKFRFSLTGSAYTGDPADSTNKTVFIEYQDLNTETWFKCLGTLPCRGALMMWSPPDQFGNTNRLWISPLITVPFGQRKPTVIRFVMERDDMPLPVIKEATVQFFQ